MEAEGVGRFLPGDYSMMCWNGHMGGKCTGMHLACNTMLGSGVGWEDERTMRHVGCGISGKRGMVKGGLECSKVGV